MASKRAQSYSSEFKEQILKECMETNKYNVVAKKHQIPVTTVYTWIPASAGMTTFYECIIINKGKKSIKSCATNYNG